MAAESEKFEHIARYKVRKKSCDSIIKIQESKRTPKMAARNEVQFQSLEELPTQS